MITAPAVTSRSGRIWAWVPVLLLGVMLTGLATLVGLAVDDPHFALEPNYYDKAVHWDEARAEARASRALDFRLEIAPTLHRAADGSIDLEVVLADRRRMPLAGAAVELEAFPNAFRKQAQRVSLHEATPGVYRGKLRAGVLGLWELRVAVTHGGRRFQQTVRRDVLGGSA